MFSKILVTALFTVFAMVASLSEAQANPAMGSEACQSALAQDKLVRVEVVKGDLRNCPRGARSPYLCALHRSGLAHRSLGHAMRTTLADLGNGTCGRVNLQGVLIYDKVRGRTLEGDDYLDPTKALPAYDLRFGAWKTAVLYLTPVSGQEQLAACTQELGSCETKLAKVERCKGLGQLYDVVQDTCMDLPTAPSPAAAPTAMTACPEPAQCPDCPTCAKDECADTVNLSPALAHDTTERLASLSAFVDRIRGCHRGESSYFRFSGDEAGNCAPLDRLLPVAATQRLEGATAELRRLRAIIRKVKSCLGRWRFTGDTNGWCDTSRR